MTDGEVSLTVTQDNTNLKILEQHADTHNDQWPKEKCWPNEFK